ncbi:MAG: bile acid:sodium symporter [Pyrinomonadaceae bacterium]|nr:bile acid:sodium symporter [Pyrinomonadaceae bacterium]
MCNVSVAATMFGYGLHADMDDILYLVRRPALLVNSFIAVFIVTPAIALALVYTFEPSLAAKVAVVALALASVTPGLPKKERESGGNESYAVGLTVAVVVSSIVITPALVELVGRIIDRPFGMSPFEIAKVMIGLALGPLAAGISFRRYFPSAAEKVQAPLIKLANAVLGITVLVILVITLPLVWEFLNLSSVLLFIAFNFFALAAGHFLGGPAPERSIVLAFSCASRHLALALSIAAANYPGQNFAAAVILCTLVNAVVFSPYVKWHRRPVALSPRSAV